MVFCGGSAYPYQINIHSKHMKHTTIHKIKAKKKEKKGLKQEGKKTQKKTISANFSAEAFQIMS